MLRSNIWCHSLFSPSSIQHVSSKDNTCIGLQAQLEITEEANQAIKQRANSLNESNLEKTLAAIPKFKRQSYPPPRKTSTKPFRDFNPSESRRPYKRPPQYQSKPSGQPKPQQKASAYKDERPNTKQDPKRQSGFKKFTRKPRQ